MARSVPPPRRSDYGAEGFFGSIAAHLALVGIILFGGFAPTEFEEAPVYSVTLEGGKTLGGISQVGDGKKSPIAPPKNVSGGKEKRETPVPTVAPTEPVVKPKPTAPPVVPTAPPKPSPPPEDKDVVKTGDESKQPTPQPTVTKAPVTPTAKPVEEKATPKPTEAPKAAATPKVAATKAVDGDDAKAKGKQKAEDPNEAYAKAMQRYLGESTAGRGAGFGAGKLGGNGMGGGEVRPPEFFRYRDLLMREVKSGWQWFDSQSQLVARVEMEIAADGRILAERIVQSSGDRSYDMSVLRAVRKADPLPAPPANVYVYFKRVTIVFDPNE